MTSKYSSNHLQIIHCKEKQRICPWEKAKILNIQSQFFSKGLHYLEVSGQMPIQRRVSSAHSHASNLLTNNKKPKISKIFKTPLTGSRHQFVRILQEMEDSKTRFFDGVLKNGG